MWLRGRPALLLFLAGALFFASRIVPALPVDRAAWCLSDWTEVDPESAAALARLKDENVGHRATTAQQNRAFIALARNPGRRPFLFFHVENAALKTLNDCCLRDRELSAALLNLYKRIFFEKLESDPVLMDHLEARYSDYKSIRLALRPGVKPEEIASRLEKAYEAAAKDFETAVAAHPQLATLFRDTTHRLAKSPSRWHLAGIGATADESSYAARDARRSPLRDDGSIGVKTFAKSLEDFETRLSNAEDARRDVERRLGRRGRVLVHAYGGSGPKILSPDAIDILRRIDAKDARSYIEAVQKEFKLQFDVDLSVEDVRALQNYYHLVDSFSPSIYIPQQDTVDLSLPAHGFVSVDLTGQNVRNLVEVMRALEESARQRKPRYDRRDLQRLADFTLGRLREGQDLASAEFERIQAVFSDALGHARRDRAKWSESGLAGDRRFSPDQGILASGDDLVFAPSRPLGEGEKNALIKHLANEGVPSHYRVVFIPPFYKDGPAEKPIVIPERARATLIVRGEEIEKGSRKILRGIVGKSDLDRLLLGIDLEVHTNGKLSVAVRLGGSFDRVTKMKVEQVARSMVEKLGETEKVEVEFRGVIDAAREADRAPLRLVPGEGPGPSGSLFPSRRYCGSWPSRSGQLASTVASA